LNQANSLKRYLYMNCKPLVGFQLTLFVVTLPTDIQLHSDRVTEAKSTGTTLNWIQGTNQL